MIGLYLWVTFVFFGIMFGGAIAQPRSESWILVVVLVMFALSSCALSAYYDMTTVHIVRPPPALTLWSA